MKVAALALALLLTAGVGCGGKAAPVKATTPVARTTQTAKEIAAAAKPAIVRVEAGDERVGTGFIVDGRGLVATNLHVVAGLASMRVILLDGRTLPVVRIAAIDGERDLVVLEVAPTAPLPSLTLGSSTTVAAGDPVVAIGNPLGVLDYTVSDGLISSVRDVSPTLTLLQISAPISQGSSGGPLFDAYGDVIGLTQAIFTGGQNLNFAIPVDYLRSLLAAPPAPLALMEFAALTAPQPSQARGGAPQILRQIPHFDLALVSECSDAGARDALALIDQTIQLGAPLYNGGDHEGCYRTYDVAARQLATTSVCPGIRRAFEAGLARAATMSTFTEQAWALRDTFDGLIELFVRRATGSGTGTTP